MGIRPEYKKELEENVNANIINWEYVEKHLASSDYRGRDFKLEILKVLKDKINGML